MRIHSMNPAVGLGVPVVPVVSQSRMTAFMADAGLSDLCVDAHAHDLGDQVYRRAAQALERPAELRARLADATAALRARTASVNSRVAVFLEAA